MGNQTYIPADQPDGQNTDDLEALLRAPLAIAETGIRKVRSFLIMNIINTIWIAYFYNAHTDASMLWMTPVFLILALVIAHHWYLYFALRSLLQLPGKMQNLSRESSSNASAFYHQNEDVISSMQGSNTQLTDAARVFASFGDTRNKSGEFQQMMSAIFRALFLGNPIILGLALGVSSLMLLVGFIMLVVHIV